MHRQQNLKLAQGLSTSHGCLRHAWLAGWLNKQLLDWALSLVTCMHAMSAHVIVGVLTVIREPSGNKPGLYVPDPRGTLMVNE